MSSMNNTRHYDYRNSGSDHELPHVNSWNRCSFTALQHTSYGRRKNSEFQVLTVDTKEREMSNSPEYNCIVDCTRELRRSAKLNLLSLCAELLAARLINEDKERSLRNRNVDEADRAAELVSLVAIKVQEDPTNYHVFVAILKKDEQQYKTVVTLLEKTYKSRKETPCVPAESVAKMKQSHSSNGHDNGALTT